ncbi:GMC oxidoreductase [Rhizobium leguminosarum]|uniref:GMC oxidoreductase n=1 Tax=Rhizobium leguminosarum TaxID=384 RepID=UPI0021BC150D|nr:GMC oxidoreductase [Rhizobium leguminosarum]
MKGAAYGRQFARTVFTRLGAQDHTHYDPSDFGYVAYGGHGDAIRGGTGTHIMGTTKTNSVVDKNQRSWDYENLYLVGRFGIANVTLTLAATCFRSSRDILNICTEQRPISDTRNELRNSTQATRSPTVHLTIFQGA